MKIFTQMKSHAGYGLLCLLLAAPVAVSCYDDSDIREKIDILVDKVLTLEERCNNEFAALDDMLNGQLFISDLSINASTNVTTVTLSNGSVLTLLPKTDLKSLVTYRNVGGTDYWAYINEAGEKVLFKNADGEPVPVMTEMPSVVVEDGDSYLVIGGMKYPLGGNSVFSDYELITDDITGEVYAVTFTFGEDRKFTVTVDGACGFHFVMSSLGWGDPSIIDNYYVACGVTASVQVDMRGVEDYVLQTPAGWRVKERSDIYTGDRYFDITAPSAVKVQSEDADAEGLLKVVAVLSGGKATTAKLYLTTNPFKRFGTAFGKVNISLYNGLEQYFYGVCPASEYDESVILPQVESRLEAYDYPAGYAKADGPVTDKAVADILGTEPEYGQEYVLWAVPMLYFQSDEDAYYYVEEGTFVKEEFVMSDVVFEVSDIAFRDAVLTMSMQGVTSYCSELVPAEDFMIEDVLDRLGRGVFTPKTPTEYKGSLFTYADVEAQSNTAYVAWFAAVREDMEYAEDDVIVREFSTLGVFPGGSADVTAGDPVLSALDVEVPLESDAAETIYYSFLTTSDAKKYADDVAKAEYLFSKGLNAAQTSVTARLSDFPAVKPKLNTKYVLLAMALDQDGKYGNVLTEEYSTTDIPFNDLNVTVSVPVNAPGDVQVAVEAEGAVELLYWFGKTSDNTWKSPNYLGGTAAKAEVYMFTNTGHNLFATAMEKYPLEDGLIRSTDLEPEAEYGIVVMAKAADGTWSHAALHKFTALPVNIGKIVMQSDPKWEAARPAVEFIPETFVPASGMMNGRYGYYVTLPKGYTGYVVSASIDMYEYEWESMRLEDWIVYLMQGEYGADNPADGTEIMRDELEFPYNSDAYHFPHGSARIGNGAGAAVIWADQEFHDKACPGHTVKTETILNKVTVPCETVVYMNTGEKVEFYTAGVGNTKEIHDQVYIVLQDKDFNCYYPYVFDVPYELFANARAN